MYPSNIVSICPLEAHIFFAQKEYSIYMFWLGPDYSYPETHWIKFVPEERIMT